MVKQPPSFDPSPLSEFNLAVGQLIRQAREERGLSQHELARQINRRQAAISALENGKLEPSSYTLVLLADVLDKPVTYFFPKPWSLKIGRGDLTYEEQTLLLEFRRLQNDNLRKIAINQVAALGDLNLDP